MITLKRIRRGSDGQPILTIEVEGWYWMYRFGHDLTKGRVDNAKVGFDIIRRVHDNLGHRSFWTMMARMWGSGTWDSETKEDWAHIRKNANYRPRPRRDY